jgi:H+/Cl- antiporter ClcA
VGNTGIDTVLLAVATAILMGVLAGFYFHVAVLLATVVLAMTGTAAITIAYGHQVWIVVVTTVLVGTALQAGYVVGNFARRRRRAPHSVSHPGLVGRTSYSPCVRR